MPSKPPKRAKNTPKPPKSTGSAEKRGPESDSTGLPDPASTSNTPEKAAPAKGKRVMPAVSPPAAFAMGTASDAQPGGDNDSSQNSQQGQTPATGTASDSNTKKRGTSTHVQNNQPDQPQGTGDSTAADAAPVRPDPDTPREAASVFFQRMKRERRWNTDVTDKRAELISAARKSGLATDDAKLRAYKQLESYYPPLEVGSATPNPHTPPEQECKGYRDPNHTCSGGKSDTGRIQGLGSLPSDWPELPPNAGQQAELSWVQANRLAVCEEMSTGATRVRLSRAHTPAPSHAALGWLETSIRSYAKYVDVVSRVLKDEADEAEHVRRERMAIEEIRELLAEMREPQE